MTTYSENRRPGDLIPHIESLEYCTVPAFIRNATGSAVDLSEVTGYPLKAGTSGADYNLAEAGDEANVLAIIVDGPLPLTLSNNTTSSVQYRVLKHPPAVINKDALQEDDPLDVALDLDAIQTAMEALGFEFRTEPTKSTTQST